MKMTKFKEDKSYLSVIDELSVQKGVAEYGVHSIRLSIEFTEEQKEKNKELAQTITKENWSIHCKESKKQQGLKVEKIVEGINNNFNIYQYKQNDFVYGSNEWDLFFWCNQGDMSYVTLNPNSKRSNQQQLQDIQKVLDFIKTLNKVDGLNVYVQYKVIYDGNKVEKVISKVLENLKEKTVKYMGMEGKIKEVGKNYEGKTVYGFFKKKARKNYYQISKEWVLQQAYNFQ